MPKKNTQKIENVSTVRAEGRGRFAVRFVENGKNRVFSRNDREEVEAKRRELLGIKAETAGAINLPDPEFSDYDGSANWWKTTIGAVTVAALKAFKYGDGSSLEKAELLSRALNQLSKAHTTYSHIQELEDTFEKCVLYMENVGHSEFVDHIRDQLGGSSFIPQTLQTAGAKGPDDPLDC